MNSDLEPLALDELLTLDERRTISVAGHHEWRESIATHKPVDEIDELVDDFDDLVVVDPYEVHAPSRKSDADLNQVLAILDNLEKGKGTTR